MIAPTPPPAGLADAMAPGSVHRKAGRQAELDRVRQAWRIERNPDARAYLEMNPHLADDPQAVLDLAYEEYCLRREGGEAVDREQFCLQFPLCRVELRKTLEVQSMLKGNPNLLDLVLPVRWPASGETICGYVLRGELGRGSFGRVFLATQPLLGGRTVVVKVSADGETEARTLGPLHHPNIVGVHHVEQDEERRLSVVCMPYEGEATLETVIRRLKAGPRRPVYARELLAAAQPVVGSLPEPRERLSGHFVSGSFAQAVAHLGAELADALEYLHRRGIYHRDLKPANVLMTPAGRPMLLDFNLADGTSPERWAVAGTIPYMAPEQIREMEKARSAAAIEPSPAQDLFSLGVLLYELLTGKHPFGPLPNAGAKWAATLLERQKRGPVPIRSCRADVDRNLAGIIEQCLAYAPEDRPDSAEQVAEALRRLIPTSRPSWRPSVVAAAVAVMVVLLAGAGWFLADRQPSAESPKFDLQTELESGLAAHAAGDHPAAIGRLTTVLQQATEPTMRAWAHYGRGRALQMYGDYAAALGDYLQAFELVPDWRFRACMGYCRNRLGSHREAAADYAWVIERGITSAAVFNNRGFSLLQQGGKSNYALAESDLAQALSLAPKLPAVQGNRIHLELRSLLAYPRRGVTWNVREARSILEAGPSDPDVAYDAMLVCMTAANRQRGREDCKPWIELAFECALRAVLRDLDPRLWQDASVVKHVAMDPRFSRLGELASESVSRPRNRNWAVCLCDPVPETDQPITPPLTTGADGWIASRPNTHTHTRVVSDP